MKTPKRAKRPAPAAPACRRSQMERSRAARAIIDCHRSERADMLALEGFMAIFHPEYTREKILQLRAAVSGRV